MTHTTHIKFAVVLTHLCLMTTVAPAQGGKLLAGLNVPRPVVNQPSPIEAKMDEGGPKLVWTVIMSKRRSRMEEGQLLLTDNTRLDGQISLHCRFDKKLDRWVFTEAEFRESKDQQSRKIPADQVQDFEFTYTIAEYTDGGRKVSNDPGKNFHPSVVKLADGTELRGLAAIHTRVGDGVPSGGGARLYFTKDQNGNLQEFRPEKLSSVTQTRSNGEFEYRSYNHALMPVLVNGKNLTLWQNPYSTSRATGFMAGLRGLGSDIAQDQMRKAAAKGAAKAEIEHRAKNGEDLIQIAKGGAKAAHDSAQQVDNAFSGIDLRGTKKEFVIRNVKTGAEVLVNDDTMAENLAPLMAACRTTAAMSKKEQKQLLEFKNLENVVRTLDQCF